MGRGVSLYLFLYSDEAYPLGFLLVERVEESLVASQETFHFLKELMALLFQVVD